MLEQQKCFLMNVLIYFEICYAVNEQIVCTFQLYYNPKIKKARTIKPVSYIDVLQQMTNISNFPINFRTLRSNFLTVLTSIQDVY